MRQQVLSWSRNMSIEKLRQEYTLAGLLEDSVHPDPVRQFGIWLAQAIAADLPEPNAMTLATVSADGQPSARMLLLKGFDKRGFVFYTNYNSAKGRHLEANGGAALVFHWSQLERQVRIEGTARRVSIKESASYFTTRPRGSQIAAHASSQSEVIPDRLAIEGRWLEMKTRFKGREVPLPPDWGGYRVKPNSIEFWQGRTDRLHDRLRYLRGAKGWKMERLSP